MRNSEILNEKSRSEWERLIDEWVHNQRDREMLKRRLLDGVCIEPLSEEFNLSAVQTQSIISKAQKQLFKHI